MRKIKAAGADVREKQNHRGKMQRLGVARTTGSGARSTRTVSQTHSAKKEEFESVFAFTRQV